MWALKIKESDLCVARAAQEAGSSLRIHDVKAPQLRLFRSVVSWLFGHNHQNSSACSAERNSQCARGHFHLWVILFKCCSHSYRDFSFYSASLFHGEVLITLNSLTVVLCSAQSSTSVCMQAIKTSAQRELEGTESSSFWEEKRMLKKVKWSLKERFHCSQELVRSLWRESVPAQSLHKKTGVFSPPAFTLTPFHLSWALRYVTNTGRSPTPRGSEICFVNSSLLKLQWLYASNYKLLR